MAIAGQNKSARKLAEALFEHEWEREAFLSAMRKGNCRDLALLITQRLPALNSFSQLDRVTWQPDWIWRVDPDLRPGLNPLHELGAYYILDFSSVFEASPLLSLSWDSPRVLDLCAAPGGKSIFASNALSPEFIVCNETVRKRSGALIENLRRCKIPNVAVTSADPSVFARQHAASFHVVIVDAPCSGQSLLAKGMKSENCFKAEVIDENVGRQRRILSHAVSCMIPGGNLLYSTCTFSRKENEKIVEWLLSETPGLRTVEVPILAPFQSKLTTEFCYRLFPHQGLGAGGFTSLMQLDGDPPTTLPDLEELPILWRDDWKDG